MATPSSPPQSESQDIDPASADAAEASVVDLELGEYSEIHETQTVPTKTGETDDDQRPLTANSAYSGANTDDFETSAEAQMLKSLTHMPNAIEQSEDADVGTGTGGFFDNYRAPATDDSTVKFTYGAAHQPKMDLVGSHGGKRPAKLPVAPESTTIESLQDSQPFPSKREKRKANDDHGRSNSDDAPDFAGKDVKAPGQPTELSGKDADMTLVTQAIPTVEAKQGSVDAFPASAEQTDLHRSVEPVGPPRKKRKKRKKILPTSTGPEERHDQQALSRHPEQPIPFTQETGNPAIQGPRPAQETHTSVQHPQPNATEANLPEHHDLAMALDDQDVNGQHQIHDLPTVTTIASIRPATAPALHLTDGLVDRSGGYAAEGGQNQPVRGHGLTHHVVSILERYDALHSAEMAELVEARDRLVNENERLSEAAQHLRDQIDTAVQEKAGLTRLVEQHRQKLKSYVAKMSRLKIFVDGLGHDVDALKKESNATKRRGDELAREGEDRKAENTALYAKLSACTEKSTRLKNDAVDLCRQANEERLRVCERNEWLVRRLDEISGLLVEERDRRMELERRLDDATNMNLMRAIQSSHDALIEKLYEIQEAAGAESKAFAAASEMTASTLAAVQALTSQHSSNADDICSIQASLETIGKAITRVAQVESNMPPALIDTEGLRAIIRTAMQALKSDVQRLEQQLQQSAETGALSVLQGQLDASNARCNHLEQQVEVLNREKLANDNHVHTIPAQPTSPSRMRELQAKLDAMVQDLDAAKAALASKDDAISTLREKVRELDGQLTITESRCLKLEVALKEEGDKVRKHYKAHSEQVIAEYSAKKDNELHAAMQEKDKLRLRIAPLENELSRCKGQMSGLEAQMESLQRSKADTEASAKQVEDLTSEFSAERATHQQREAELQDAVATAESTHATVKAELTVALEKLGRHEAGIEHLKQDCKRQVEAEEERGRKRVEALQQRLEEAEAELQASKDEQSRFATEVQESWNTETAQHAKQLSAAKANMTQTERERDEAQAERARLQKELEQLAAKSGDLAAAQAAIVRAETVRDEATAQIAMLRQELSELTASRSAPLPSSDRPLNIMPRISVPMVAETVPSLTPLTSNKENEPPRPRKKMDRKTQQIIEEGPIPAPDVLLPSSRQRTADSSAHEPIIEDSQQPDPISVPLVVQQSQLSLPFSHMRSIRADSEDMLDTASHIFPLSTQVVEETQYDDLPTFAAFNAGIRTAHQSSILSIPHSSQQSFAILEDPQSQGSYTQAQTRKPELSEAEKEKFTYRKTFPHPNSASKLKPRQSTQGSANSRSSSPAFVKESVQSRKVSTYQGGESATKKRTVSRAGFYNPPTDPRLVGRESSVSGAPPKRKGGQIREGYEHERQKRKRGSQHSSQPDVESQSGRYSLRGGGAPPSVRDLPSMTSSSSGRHGHGRDSAPLRSQMRSSSGPTGEARKSMSKNDQYAARFASELRR